MTDLIGIIRSKADANERIFDILLNVTVQGVPRRKTSIDIGKNVGMPNLTKIFSRWLHFRL